MHYSIHHQTHILSYFDSFLADFQFLWDRSLNTTIDWLCTCNLLLCLFEVKTLLLAFCCWSPPCFSTLFWWCRWPFFLWYISSTQAYEIYVGVESSCLHFKYCAIWSQLSFGGCCWVLYSGWAKFTFRFWTVPYPFPNSHPYGNLDMGRIL